MSTLGTFTQRRKLARGNAKMPVRLAEVPRDHWPPALQSFTRVSRVWRSQDFLVQLYDESGPALFRLSVIRTSIRGDRWADGITWDELQRIKREVGFGDCDALEVYPADRDVVNVANMRHLWIMRDPVPFAWRRDAPSCDRGI